VLKIQFIIYKTCYVLFDEVPIRTTYHGFPPEVMVGATKLRLIVVSHMMTQAYIINGGRHPSVEYEIVRVG
jgi:hypothetical protein